MNWIKKILRGLFYSKLGKPNLMSKLIIIGTRGKFIHDWISGNLQSEDIVLDVGARTFPFTKYQKVKAVYGIDLPTESQGYLGYTNKSLSNISKIKNIFPVFGNCEEMPFADSSFDKIIMIEVIEHVEHDEKAFLELARVLKENGMLFITTPNGREVENTNPYHLRHYNPDELMGLLKKYFNDVNIKQKFPNQKLYIKQNLPQNKNIIKRLFWKWNYEIWYYLYGRNNSNGGYTLVCTCSKPIKYNNLKNNNICFPNILVCPKCKNELKNKQLQLECSRCQKNYKTLDGIPYFLLKVPKHQQGPPTSHISEWKEYNKESKNN
jgi:ubiquinone/menaquinone biosynthesis C-methylase UbiE